jgi:hypothetical protein
MAITINGTTGIAGVDGSASTPAVQGADTNTGIFFPAADTIGFAEGGAEVMRINSSGNVGIGTTSPSSRLHVASASDPTITLQNTAESTMTLIAGGNGQIRSTTALDAYTNGSLRTRITSGGDFLVNTTSGNLYLLSSGGGFAFNSNNRTDVARQGDTVFTVNRTGDDGELVAFFQGGTQEGNISVSGSTVSYNGGHLSRWAQILGTKDDTLVKGTVMSNLDEMNVYTDAEGNPVDNEQLNKVKVSDVEGDVNVAGVFVIWSYDETHQVDEINMAMTGDMIIRIAQGVVVQKGDLLMSAGDGTAKPQGDDIVRSKTVAKVTSNHVTCTYEDGSYCVPCVLMAC